MEKDYLKIYQDKEGNFNYSHPALNVGTMLALIGYMEKIKIELLTECEKLQK